MIKGSLDLWTQRTRLEKMDVVVASVITNAMLASVMPDVVVAWVVVGVVVDSVVVA